MLGLVEVGIEIERWGQAPSGFGQEESMIAQVIVAISNGDVESHATVELLKIRGDVIFRSLSMEEFCQLQIAHAFALASRRFINI